MADPDTALDLDSLTVADIRAGFAASTFTAEDLTRASLARIDATNDRLNAVIFRNDADALETARDVDRRRAAGETLAPLAGVPVVIKDPMDMAGFPTTAGWRLLHAASGGVAT